MSKPRARAAAKRVPKGLVLSLLLSGTAATALIAPAAVYAGTTGIVQGTIRDANGNPLRAVRVLLVGTGQRTTTNGSGQYTFIGVTPGGYQVRAEIVTFSIDTQSVTVTQDQTTTLDFALTKSTITGTRTVTVIPTVKQTQTASTQVITRQEESQKRSQPYSLYQTPGILLGEPGISVDAATGIDHIRGGDYNQTGYQIDGISVIDPLGGGFDTNLVTVGLKSANYYAGGEDASYGGSAAGTINTITLNGRDIKGGETEYTFGPGHGWNYNGTNTKYGNVTSDGKFDFIVNTLQFQNGFPKGVFGLKTVKSSDISGKFNFYANPNDTFTGYYAQGFELYDLPDLGLGPTTNKYEPDQGNNIIKTSPQLLNHQTQDYELTYLNYKHNFSPTAFSNFKVYQLHQAVAVHLESAANEYLGVNETENGLTADYSNQLSRAYNLRFGYAYEPSGNYENVLIGLTAPYQTLSSPNGFGNRVYDNRLYRNTLYLTNHVVTPGNKLTADFGVRYSSQKYGLKDVPTATGPGLTTAALASSFNPSYTTHYVDPRLGLNYSPTKNLVFRSNYSTQSQFADAGRAQYAQPYYDGNTPQSATDPASQAIKGNYGFNRYASYNHLQPSHLNNLDLGVETGYDQKAGFFTGQYNVSVTGYKRNGYDDILYTRDSFTPLGGLRHYTNEGTQHSSGVEFVLRKQKRKDSDTSGFFSYTNQVVKSTATFLNGYISDFYNATAGTTLGGVNKITNAQYSALNRQETPTNYAERNTYYVLLTKKLNKFLEPSLSVDAGSGYPYVSGVITSSISGVGAGLDSQHTIVDNTLQGAGGVGAASFDTVPVVLSNRTSLSPLNVQPGKTGWHYKFTLNTNFLLTQNTSLFLNVDNIFGRQTAQIFGTSDERGSVFYDPPSSAYPQGRVYYGARDFVTPTSFQIGFRQKF